MNSEQREKLADLAARSDRERKRFRAQRPKRVSQIVSGVMAKRGYAAQRSVERLQQAWEEVVRGVLGDATIARLTRVDGLRRGRLEVTVANHVVMQEINFYRPQLLAAAQTALPTARLTAIRFKAGRLGA